MTCGVRYRDRPRRYVVLRVALMKSTVFPLFAYPVVACAPIYQFSDEERAFIDGLEMIDNTGNRMSKDTSILESEELAGVKAYIEEQLASYKTGLLRMKDENEIYITQSWSNKATSSQFHQRHKLNTVGSRACDFIAVCLMNGRPSSNMPCPLGFAMLAT